MNFAYKHNGQVIDLEYDEDDAADQDGSVWSCKVTYQGKIVTKLLSDHEETFAEECAKHFERHCIEAKFEAGMDRGQELYEDRMCT